MAFAQRAGYEVVGTYKETASGVRLDRAERRKVLALAQRREIDTVLVTELSRWGRSTTDLLATLKELETRRVSLVALNGMAFDLTTPHGRMMATLLAGISEFEREGVVQIRVTPKTRNPFTISSLSTSGVTWEWHFLNHASLSYSIFWSRYEAET